MKSNKNPNHYINDFNLTLFLINTNVIIHSVNDNSKFLNELLQKMAGRGLVTDTYTEDAGSPSIYREST